jgi:hypothetical protein
MATRRKAPPGTRTRQPARKADTATTETPLESTDLERGELRHLDGCPGGRLETYDVPAPRNEYRQVTRCLECGASVAT